MLNLSSKALLPIFEGVAERVWSQLKSQLRQARQSGHHAKVIKKPRIPGNNTEKNVD